MMASRAPRLALFAGILLGVSLSIVGCGQSGGPDGTPKPIVSDEDDPLSGGQALPQGGGERAEAVALTAAELRPRFQGVGPAGVAPERFLIQLRYPVFKSIVANNWSPDGTYPPPEDLQAKITPAVDGRWVVASESSLAFIPSEALTPRATYRVELEAIPYGEEQLQAPADGSWVGEIETPAFAFQRFVVEKIVPERMTGMLQLVFSYPVDPNEVASRATFVLGGITSIPAVERTASPNVVRVTFRDGRLGREDLKAEVRIESGVPLKGSRDITALGGDGEVLVRARGGLEIIASRLKEAGTGHFIEVICRDEKAPGGDRWYWDRETYDSYELSSRCVLDPEVAQEVIHFEPAVKFYTARSESGFRIFGEFQREAYALRIDAGARTLDGGYLPATYEAGFDVPARSPKLSFVHTGRYLPKEAWDSLSIAHLNVPGITLTVRHVPPENLTFWLSGDSEEATARTSNVVLSKAIPLQSPEDKEMTSAIPIGDLLPNPTRGVYELRIEGADEVDAARLLLTDMNLIAKAAAPASEPAWPWPRSVHVWAVGMGDLAPLSDVRIRAVRQSRQVMASCFTDDSGGCTLEMPEPGIDTSPPFALIATRGSDLTYLAFDELRLKTSEEVVSGKPYRGGAAYSASIYSDRGVYRPGDTAHLGVILRDRAISAPQAGMPVKLEILDPRQKVIRRITEETNAAGMVVADVAFAAFADTGRYQARLLVAGHPVATYGFSVEEFVPERMKVVARPGAEAYRAGEEPIVEVEARYLFGGTAAGSPVEVRCALEAGSFKPERNGEYTYGVWTGAEEGKGAVSLGTATGELGPEGILRLPCPSGEGGQVVGPGQLKADVAVFEAGSGRTTTATARVPIHPAPYYVGMKTGTETAQAGQPFKVEGIVVDWQGRVVKDGPTSLDLRLSHLEAEYTWGYWDEYGEESFEREMRVVPEGKQTVTVKDGRFSLEVRPATAPEGFLVQALYEGTRTDLRIEGQGGGYYFGGNARRIEQTPRPSRPSTLALKVGATRVGAPVPVSFDAPYRGRVLLTVETDELLTQAWKVVEPGPVEWQFTLQDFAPNVYVSALLMKDPHLDSPQAFKPDRAFGVVSARVEPEAYRAELKMDVPAEVRSNATLTVNLDLSGSGDGAARGPTFVTVAAVDEGILSLTKFESPDPFKDIFAQRALGVTTYETIGWSLLVPPSGPSSSTGGGAMEGPGRVQPVKPVALWSGLVEVPASGKVSIDFEVPQYRGALRVMAVAASKGVMAHASAEVLVRDPIVLQTTLPRFLAFGDVVDIPVFLTNLTGAAQDISVNLEAETLPMAGVDAGLDAPPPLSFVGGKQGKLRLEDGAAGTVVFKVRATQTVGAARLKVRAKAKDFESFESLEVPFNPAGPRVRKVVEVPLKAGKNDLLSALGGWVPTTEKTTIWVTANPFAQSFDHLKYLIRYPYGCIEQTTSSTRPLLYVSNLLKQVDPETAAASRIEPMVIKGIDRVISMQTPSGGFAYWPGGDHISPWAHAYATHMLLDAKALQYPVSQDALDQALGWIERNLNGSTQGGNPQVYGDAEAYMHYVLAKAGKGRKARIQSLIAKVEGPKKSWVKEQRYLLLAALYLTGDHRYEAELKDVDTSAVEQRGKYYYNYYSDLRRRGLTLSVFQDLFGKDEAGLPLAKLVARDLGRKRSGWYSTQELVWGVTALGRWVGAGSVDFDPPTLTAGGKPVAPQSLAAEGKTQATESPERTYSLYRASEVKELTLTLKPFKAEQVLAIVSSEGVRAGEGYQLGGAGLSLKRTYMTPEGEPLSLSGGSIQLGDLIYVQLELENKTGTEIQNIALVDRLPAGWEIENPRLGRGGDVDWWDTDTRWEADHMNLRDDRVEIFGDLAAGGKGQILFAVRAVTAGKFTLPPASAEAMYDPEQWSRVGGGIVEIAGPWAGLYL